MSLSDGKSKLQPDNRIDVSIDFQDGDAVDTYWVPQPRIVLETAFSQVLADAEEKAWEYLHATGHHTHGVIIVDMTYPVTEEKKFVAKIALWCRADTGEDGKMMYHLCFLSNTLVLAVDYPFEGTEDYKHTPDLSPEEADSPTSAGLSKSPSATSTSLSEGTTKVDIVGPQRREGGPAGARRAIETSGYIASAIPVHGGPPANRLN